MTFAISSYLHFQRNFTLILSVSSRRLDGILLKLVCFCFKAHEQVLKCSKCFFCIILRPCHVILPSNGESQRVMFGRCTDFLFLKQTQSDHEALFFYVNLLIFCLVFLHVPSEEKLANDFTFL